MARRPAPLGYFAALRWLLDNDDTEFLSDPEPCISVSAALVADIFHRTNEEVLRDLFRMKGSTK